MQAPIRPNYEYRVGLFTVIALMVLLWGWGWLKSASLFRLPQRFTVQFHDIAGLTKNAPVNINGVRVGTVEEVKLRAKGVVHCLLKITAEGVVVTEGSTVTIQTLGLVGAKYIEISLPAELPGKPAPQAIPENAVVTGQDPVRVELVLNDIAAKISRMFKGVKGEEAGKSLSRALENSGAAMENFNQAAKKLNKNLDRINTVADSVEDASSRIGHLATRADGAVDNASAFFNRGKKTMGNIDDLATDLRGTAGRINKILDNPNFSRDLKETAQLAKQTADSVSVAIHELNKTLTDEPVRRDVIEILNKINTSTEKIYQSIKTINDLARDGELRQDVKQIVNDAKEAMSKVGAILEQPDFKTDVRQTIHSVKSAADNVDKASRQLQQVLDKRAPLIQMMFLRPGKLKEPQIPPPAGSKP